MAYQLAAGDSRAILRSLRRGLVRAANGLLPVRPQRAKPLSLLQRIRAMTMVNDHLLSDIGLDRTAIVIVGRRPEATYDSHFLHQSTS